MMKTQLGFPVKMLVVAAAFAIALAAVPAYAADVSIGDNFFDPGTVTIDTGDSVTWTNNGERIHTVTSDDGSFDSGAMASTQTFSHTFNAAGTFPYYCEIHGGPGGSGMSGEVVVRAATSTTPSPSQSTTSPANESTQTDVAGESLARTASPLAPLAPLAGTGIALIVLGVPLVRLGRRDRLD